MNHIKIEYKPYRLLPSRKLNLNHPEKWEELTPEQLIIGASVLEGIVSDDKVIRVMTGLKRRVIKRLTPYQKLRIIELLKFLNDFTPYHEFIIPALGHLKCPKPRLKDETFGCFIFAETYFFKYELSYDESALDKFIACFYRDREFDEKFLDENSLLVSKQKYIVRQAIYTNYKLIREYLVLNYPYVFSREEDQSSNKDQSKWLDVFDAIVKDDIVRQEDYARLPISTVLRYLNNQIKNSRTK